MQSTLSVPVHQTISSSSVRRMADGDVHTCALCCVKVDDKRAIATIAIHKKKHRLSLSLSPSPCPCPGSRWFKYDSSLIRNYRRTTEEESLALLLTCCSHAPNSSEAAAADNGNEEQDDGGGGIGLSIFREFLQLSEGHWVGHFHQYDLFGGMLQQIPTRVNSYTRGRGTDMTLCQTLNIKEAVSKTSVPDESDEPNWVEWQLDEATSSTVERSQQIAYFPGARAFCLSHQTAEMIDKLLRTGVLGKDDDNQESPIGVKLPSRRPAIVSESCLYSEDGSRRVRAFIVLDPRGLPNVIGVFNEKRMEGSLLEVKSELSKEEAVENVDSICGKWVGNAVTRRTGIYGSTVVENNVSVDYRKLPGGLISQELSSSLGFKVNLKGQIKGSVLDFEGGLQTILLPGGLMVSTPTNVGKSVGRSQSFFFEFSWMESAGKRRRLVRTYDTDGLVVSTTLSSESKV